MILENTKESVDEALRVLGLSRDNRLGMVRPQHGKWEPFIQEGDRRWYVGDEVRAEDRLNALVGSDEL